MAGNRIAVYPYSAEFDPVLEYAGLLSPGNEISALVSPRGWGLSGKRVSLGKTGKQLTVLSELSEIEEDVNCILIPAFASTVEYQMELLGKVEEQAGIQKIICSAKLEAPAYEKLSRMGQDRELVFNLNPTLPQRITREIQGKVYPVEVPVIAVAGVWENTDKFEVSLRLREMFLKNGYRVSQIGSRNYCELLGFHSFPEFMLRPGMEAADKITAFSCYVQDILKEEDPDVLILSVPGAIQPINGKFGEGFGVLPFLAFSAVSVDFLILCTLYGFDSASYYKEISSCCKYRLGAPVDYFHVSGCLLDFSKLSEWERLVWKRMDKERVIRFLEERLHDIDIPVGNIYNDMVKQRIFDTIIDKLAVI